MKKLLLLLLAVVVEVLVLVVVVMVAVLMVFGSGGVGGFDGGGVGDDGDGSGGGDRGMVVTMGPLTGNESVKLIFIMELHFMNLFFQQVYLKIAMENLLL